MLSLIDQLLKLLCDDLTSNSGDLHIWKCVVNWRENLDYIGFVTSCDLVTHFSWASGRLHVFYLQLSLALGDIYLSFPWPFRWLLFWFYDTQLKYALFSQRSVLMEDLPCLSINISVLKCCILFPLKPSSPSKHTQQYLFSVI